MTGDRLRRGVSDRRLIPGLVENHYYEYQVTKKQVPSDVQRKVAVSETPNSWVEYEDD